MDVKTQIARALATKNRQMPLGPVIQALVGEPDPKTLGREQFMRMDGNEAFDTFEGMQSEPGYPWREGRMDGSSFNDAGQYQVAQATLTDAVNDPDRPVFDEKITEGQSKDVGYFRRGAAANQELNQLENSLTQWTDSAAQPFGAVGRLFQDEGYQQARRAANEFLAMVLRKDTGAAVTNEEFKLYGPMYIPMPGDKPETIAAKRQAREQFLIALMDASGSARPILGNAAEELAAPPAAPAPSGDGWQEINGVRVRVKQ
jgi:hypothetical protein